MQCAEDGRSQGGCAAVSPMPGSALSQACLVSVCKHDLDRLCAGIAEAASQPGIAQAVAHRDEAIHTWFHAQVQSQP